MSDADSGPSATSSDTPVIARTDSIHAGESVNPVTGGLESWEGPPRVLVVEDDGASRELMLRRLASRGLSVSAVADGEACLARLHIPPVDALLPEIAPAAASTEEPPDLILLDINLPRATGLEVLQRIRWRYSHDVLPVILVTALGDSDDVVRGLEAGANDYVVKPVDLPVLMARIQVSLKIKYGVRLLMEAERQRVMMETLGEACDQLSQPTTAISCMLEAIIRTKEFDPEEARADLREVLRWTNDVSSLIHKLRGVVNVGSTPYLERMQMLERGTVKDRFRRKV